MLALSRARWPRVSVVDRDVRSGCGVWVTRIRYAACVSTSVSCESAIVVEKTQRTKLIDRRGSRGCDVQIGSARAIPAFITFDFQRSEVASRPGNGRVHPVAIADIDHGACVPCRGSPLRRGWACWIFPADRGDRGYGSPTTIRAYQASIPEEPSWVGCHIGTPTGPVLAPTMGVRQ